MAGRAATSSRRPSPYVIGGGIVTLAALRIAIGDFGWPDLVAVAAMLVVYPFGEWAIHVYLLHMPPFKFRGRAVELPPASDHREHHERAERPQSAAARAARARRAAARLASRRRSACWRAAVGWSPARSPVGAVVSAALAGYVLHLRLRVDPLPDPHRLPAALALLPRGLAQPPAAPLQERALLARDHQQRSATACWARTPISARCRRSRTARTLSR